MAEIYPGNCVESADGSYRMVRHLRVAMRDDVTLATDLLLPAEEGAHPVALVRTPYDRERYIKPFFPQHGIVLVTQDCRGRYDSDGTHHPFEDDVEDGDDTLQWIFDQPWCNGRIGMFGGSYVAYTQYAAASNQRPELTALAPYFMTGDGWARGYYCGGALSLSLTWSWLCFVDISRTNSSPTMELLDVETAVFYDTLLVLAEVGWFTFDA